MCMFLMKKITLDLNQRIPLAFGDGYKLSAFRRNFSARNKSPDFAASKAICMHRCDSSLLPSILQTIDSLFFKFKIANLTLIFNGRNYYIIFLLN